jgi:mRNA interferase RelE/StbE
MIAIEYKKNALRALRKADQKTRERLMAKIWQLADDPDSLANNIKRLKSKNESFRLRVGNWRIIYEFRDNRLVLLIIDVKQRGGAYKDME